MATKTEHAILAGGCFWGMELLLSTSGESFQPESVTPVGTSRMRPTEITGTHAEAIESCFNLER